MHYDARQVLRCKPGQSVDRAVWEYKIRRRAARDGDLDLTLAVNELPRDFDPSERRVVVRARVGDPATGHRRDAEPLLARFERFDAGKVDASARLVGFSESRSPLRARR
jgi:hypothetical protein